MKISEIEYYGAEIDFPEDMKEFWRFGFPEDRGWKMHFSHCTFGHFSNMTVESLLSAFMNRDEECELVIDAVGRYTLPGDEGEVVAFRVKENKVTVDDFPMRGENRVFHITAFTRGKATAKDSNNILKWESMGEIKLRGRIKFWMKRKEGV